MGTDSKGHVTRLILPLCNLTGTFPFEELIKLTELTYLSISNTSSQCLSSSNNDVSRTIPADITKLKQLYLSNNNLSGTIPIELGELPFTSLSLSDNDFSEPVDKNVLPNGLNSLNLTGNPLLCSTSTKPSYAFGWPTSCHAFGKASPLLLISDDTSLHVYWEEIPINNTGAISTPTNLKAGYDIQYQKLGDTNCSDHTRAKTENSTDTNTTITGLDKTATYLIRIRPTTIKRIIPTIWSRPGIISMATGNAPAAPPAPQLMPGTERIAAIWGPPQTGGTPTGYDIQHREKGAAD